MPAIKKKPTTTSWLVLKNMYFYKRSNISNYLFPENCPGLFNIISQLHKMDRINEEQGWFFFFSSYLLRPFGRENCHSTQSKELQPAMPAPRSAWFHSVRSLRHWIQDVRAGLLENSPHKSAQLKLLAPWYAVTDVLVGRDLWWALAQTLAWHETITNTLDQVNHGFA